MSATGLDPIIAECAGIADIIISVVAATKTCKRYPVDYKGKKFTIIDTPGLADKNTHEENMEILEQIARQLAAMGQRRVNGVIYFHSIQNVRLGKADLANFRILKAICGENFPDVAFVTTRWDRLDLDKYRNQYETINHDLEMERRNLLPKGPRIFKFLNDDKSHRRVLDYFADKVHTAGTELPAQLQFAQELKRYQYEKKPEKAVRKTQASKRMVAESQKVSEGNSCCIIQ